MRLFSDADRIVAAYPMTVLNVFRTSTEPVGTMRYAARTTIWVHAALNPRPGVKPCEHNIVPSPPGAIQICYIKKEEYIMNLSKLNTSTTLAHSRGMHSPGTL